MRTASEITRSHITRAHFIAGTPEVAAWATDNPATFWRFRLFLLSLCTFVHSIDNIELGILRELTHLVFDNWNKSKRCQASEKDGAPPIIKERPQDNMVNIVIKDKSLNSELYSSHQAEEDSIYPLILLKQVLFRNVNWSCNKDELVNHKG